MPPSTISVRNRRQREPGAGLYAESSAITSPQNPARPGSPSDAIAVNASRLPSYGTFWSMPPPISAISRVWYRSWIEPARKNSMPVITPWATMP